MQLNDNVILITGGTSGIGRGLAEQFHRRGNKVIIAGRRQHLLDEIVAANPGMEGVVLDVANADSIETVSADLRTRFPDLNVLINNAGVAGREDYLSNSFDLPLVQSIVQTNIVSVIHLTSALLPTLVSQPHSTIITTTSGLGFIPMAPVPTYSASKAFLHSWLQSLRHQLRDTPIEILELIPPYVQTHLGGERQASDPYAMPLDDFIAEVIAELEKGVLPRGEILVERAKEYRVADDSEDYARVFAQHNQF